LKGPRLANSAVHSRRIAEACSRRCPSRSPCAVSGRGDARRSLRGPLLVLFLFGCIRAQRITRSRSCRRHRRPERGARGWRRSSPLSMETWPGPQPRPRIPHHYAGDRKQAPLRLQPSQPGPRAPACGARRSAGSTKDVRGGPWPSGANRAEGLSKGGSRYGSARRAVPMGAPASPRLARP